MICLKTHELLEKTNETVACSCTVLLYTLEIFPSADRSLRNRLSCGRVFVYFSSLILGFHETIRPANISRSGINDEK